MVPVTGMNTRNYLVSFFRRISGDYFLTDIIGMIVFFGTFAMLHSVRSFIDELIDLNKRYLTDYSG